MSNITNTTSTFDFIQTINKELSSVTKSWKRIAQAFYDADEQFSSSSDEFKAIMKATGFNLATATKLVKIAQSDRLKRHADVFAKVHAWTVLYAVTTLTDEQFARLLVLIPEGSVVKSSMVAKAKETEKKETDPYKPIFTIRIDENALRGDLFDGDDYANLHNLVAEIQKSIPYLRVDTVDRFDNSASLHNAGLQKQYGKILTKRFGEAIANYKQSSSEWINYHKSPTKRNKPLIAIFQDVADANLALRENPAAAFAALGSDLFDMAAIWNEASQTYAAKTNEYATKANTEFCYASSIVPIEPEPVPEFLTVTAKSSKKEKYLKLAA